MCIYIYMCNFAPFSRHLSIAPSLLVFDLTEKSDLYRPLRNPLSSAPSPSLLLISHLWQPYCWILPRRLSHLRSPSLPRDPILRLPLSPARTHSLSLLDGLQLFPARSRRGDPLQPPPGPGPAAADGWAGLQGQLRVHRQPRPLGVLRGRGRP